MDKFKSEVIRKAVAEGTGAKIKLRPDNGNPMSGVKLWFSDLDRTNGPTLLFGPSGLKRHSIGLSFGRFSRPIVEQIADATEEKIQLARALVRSIDSNIVLTFSGPMDIHNWIISDSTFRIDAERKNIRQYLSDEALEQTCNDIVVPIMAAMAELIGYEVLSNIEKPMESAPEGALRLTTVVRRERNPRNRLLCLRIHGHKCGICHDDLLLKYGDAGSIIEVHHIQPLSELLGPRAYDPEKDLIPLCPNCHRAIHSRKPVPWTPGDIIEMINND